MTLYQLAMKLLFTPDRFRPILTPRIRYWSSAARVESRHFEAEKARRKAGAARVVSYYFQADDPHSVVTAPLLARLLARYQVEIDIRIVGAHDPRIIAAPVEEDYVAYTRKDVADVAAFYGAAFEDRGRQPGAERVAKAQAICARMIERGEFVEGAEAVTRALWQEDASALDGLAERHGEMPEAELAALCRRNEAQRKRDGYVYAGTFYYGGEWFLGLDRLIHLEERLESQGALRDPALPKVAPRPVEKLEAIPGAESVTVELFASMRSPYSYVAMARVFDFARALGVRLVLRPVLPLVMRGTRFRNASSQQAVYVYTDCAREARRLGLPYGDIVDCMGSPVEAVYALLPFAREQGRGDELLWCFIKGVFSEGIDAGTDAGLQRIVESAGLDWDAARTHIGSDPWRKEIDANLEEMSRAGIWGVPSFRVTGGSGGREPFFTWGQDRFFLVEAEVARRCAS